MGPDFLLGLVIFFGFLFIGRVFNMKAINSLTNEEKGKMITVLQGLQKFYLFAIYLVGINVFVYKRLSGLNFKKDFNKNFIISKILNYIGLAVFFVYLLMDL